MLDWLACNVVIVIGAILCRLPASVVVWLGERLGDLAYWLQPRRTRIGLWNLRAAFDGQLMPSQARRIIQASYRQLGAGVLELLRLPVVDRAYVDRYITIEGLERFEAARAAGRPVILLTAHYGNWELSSIVTGLNGYPIVALARAQEKFPRLYRLLVSYRESKGCTIIHKGGAMKRLIAALEAGRPVGIVGDQASRQGLFVDFFGRPALFATGPFALAHRNHAVIFPAFIHRVGGSFHRIVVEPPIELPRHLPKEDAVRWGIEAFAEALTRHIAEDPRQWLWMHKRWKYTPARRVLILSDGKIGHLKQSLTVLDAIRSHQPLASHHVVEVRFRSRLHRAIALLWSWGMPNGVGAARCLQGTLTPDTAGALLSRYADAVVSCGASTAPVNVLWAAEHRARSIVIMNPAPLPLRRFSLVIAPRHDGLPKRANVVQTAGALVSQRSEEELLRARLRLQTHPNARLDVSATTAKSGQAVAHSHPVVAVFIGGDTAHYALNTAFAETLLAHVESACERCDGWYLVTTSRRTAPAVERALSERLAGAARCRLLLIANRDPIDGTMDGMLGCADVAVVTGESISMVSEACASGRRVIVVEPPLCEGHRPALTKHQRFLRGLVADGYVRLAPVAELGVAIQRALAARQAPKRLDNFTAIRHAISRVL